MKCNIFKIIMVVILFLPWMVYGNDVNSNILTLDQAVKLTLKNNLLIKKINEDVMAANTGIKIAESSYFPIVNGEVSYNYMGPSQDINLGPGMNFSLFPENNYNFQISAVYTLYEFGKRKKMVELAKLKAEESQTSLNQIKINLAYQTIEVFYSVLFLQKQLDVLNEQIHDLKRHLDFVTQRKLTGSATPYDVLNTKVRLAQVKSKLIDIQNSYKKQKIALELLTGMKFNTLSKVIGNFDDSKIEIDIQSLLVKALKNRPEVRQAFLSANIADLNTQIASLKNMPTISTYVLYGFKNGLLPDVDNISSHWSVGIKMDVPIFNETNKTQKMVIDKNYSAAQQNINYIKSLIKSQIEQAVNDLKAREAQIESSQIRLNQAKELLKIAKIKYSIGLITNLEYLDTQTSVKQAKLSYLSALYNYVLSKYRLKKTVGDVLW